MERVCIFAKDVARLVGMTEREAQRLLRIIRAAHNKNKNQYVTIKEFSEYTGISEELIKLR